MTRPARPRHGGDFSPLQAAAGRNRLGRRLQTPSQSRHRAGGKWRARSGKRVPRWSEPRRDSQKRLIPPPSSLLRSADRPGHDHHRHRRRRHHRHRRYCVRPLEGVYPGRHCRVGGPLCAGGVLRRQVRRRGRRPSPEGLGGDSVRHRRCCCGAAPHRPLRGGRKEAAGSSWLRGGSRGALVGRCCGGTGWDWGCSAAQHIQSELTDLLRGLGLC